MTSTTSDADQEETIQEIATKIEKHKERLLCVRSCLKNGWVSDPDNFYAAMVCGIEDNLWIKHWKGALALGKKLQKIHPCQLRPRHTLVSLFIDPT